MGGTDTREREKGERAEGRKLSAGEPMRETRARGPSMEPEGRRQRKKEKGEQEVGE